MSNIPRPSKKELTDFELSRMRGGRGRRLFNEKAKNRKKTFSRLIKFLAQDKLNIMLVIMFVIITSALSLLSPIIQSEAIDSITLTEEKLNVDFDLLYKMLTLMGIVFVATCISSYLQQYFSAKLSLRMVYRMRKEMFDRTIRLPIGFHDTHRHGDLLSRMTNDATNISNTVSQTIGTIVSGIITIIGCLVVMIIRSPFLTIMSFVSIGLSLLISKILSKFMRRYFKKQQELLGELNSHVEEYVTGYKTVIAYNKQEDVNEVFGEISKEYTKYGIKANIASGVMGPLMNITHNLSFLLMCGFGAILVIRPITIGSFVIASMISVGTIQLFNSYSQKISQPINQIANVYAQIQTALAGAERVFEILDEKEEIDEGIIELDPKAINGLIEFKHVNFSYVKDTPVLIDFSATVKPGHKIALVGHTGSGKTTIVNLLERYYEIDSGEILVDGINIKDISKKSLRNTIAIVLQDTVLFTDTVLNNIKYGNDEASMEEVEQASITANSKPFIDMLPDKYDSFLDSNGGNLSEGQRQLLSISRALIKNPPILILDEATSSVDTRTEKNIQEATQKLMSNRTSIIIAHRLSTIQDADLIVVLDKGIVVEEGNHQELINRQGRYYELYKTQFEGNEI